MEGDSRRKVAQSSIPLGFVAIEEKPLDYADPSMDHISRASKKPLSVISVRPGLLPAPALD